MAEEPFAVDTTGLARPADNLQTLAQHIKSIAAEHQAALIGLGQPWGNDASGHAFNQQYQPAHDQIFQGVDSLISALHGVAANLITLSHGFEKTEDHAARVATRLAPAVDATSARVPVEPPRVPVDGSSVVTPPAPVTSPRIPADRSNAQTPRIPVTPPGVGGERPHSQDSTVTLTPVGRDSGSPVTPGLPVAPIGPVVPGDRVTLTPVDPVTPGLPVAPIGPVVPVTRVTLTPVDPVTLTPAVAVTPAGLVTPGNPGDRST